MNFLLKIVEGPNKGAEIALVDGVSVTVGKGDDCDVVLADPTMPDAPLGVEVTSDGVVVGGEMLEPFAVKTFGATSFAVGPADAPWGELKWPKVESAAPEAEAGPSEDAGTASEKETVAADEPKPKSKRRGGCLVVSVLLLFLLSGIAWFFGKEIDDAGCLDRIKKSGLTEKVVAVSRDGYARTVELVATWRSQEAQPASRKPALTLPEVAAKYGLELVESNDVARMSGNLATRCDRLAATAEAYEARPGVELDVSDDESFRASADDALFTLTEGALKVGAATNRVLAVVGSSPSPNDLKKVLLALNADIPKLRDVDVSGVRFGESGNGNEASGDGSALRPLPSRAKRTASRKTQPALPVCGILTVPYPCLVMRDGRRIMEGAAIGDDVIVSIGADSVTFTNATGRFTWKP